MPNISFNTYICHHVAYFLYIIVYSCIIYVYRAMCMYVCMYHRSETLQYFNKLLFIIYYKHAPSIDEKAPHSSINEGRL